MREGAEKKTAWTFDGMGELGTSRLIEVLDTLVLQSQTKFFVACTCGARSICYCFVPYSPLYCPIHLDFDVALLLCFYCRVCDTVISVAGPDHVRGEKDCARCCTLHGNHARC